MGKSRQSRSSLFRRGAGRRVRGRGWLWGSVYGRVGMEVLEPRMMLAGLEPLINEFLADNVSGLEDKDTTHQDWIEIYNPGPAMNLAGWHLTNSSSDLDKWTFPDTPVASGGYVLVFASKKDQAIAGQELHTNFKLDPDGVYLALVNPDLTPVSEYKPKYPPQTGDVSYGMGGSQVETTTLVGSGAPTKVLIPSNGDLGTSWTGSGFVESAEWQVAMTGVGYEVGNAALANEIEPNDTTATANSAIYNFSAYGGGLYQMGLTGSLGSTATSTDLFRIGNLQNGDVLTITLAGSASRGTGFMSNPLIELYRGNAQTQTLVTSNDESGPGADALIARYAISTTDNYYIKVTKGAGGGTQGNYNVGLWLENSDAVPLTGGTTTAESENNNTFAEADDVSTSWRAVQYRSRTSASISLASDVDVYSYQLNKGDLVTVRIDSTSALDAKISLLASDGTVLATEDGSSVFASPYDKDSAVYGYIIPNAGIYYVRVQAAGGTGTYNAEVYLSSVTAPPTSSGWGTYGGKIAGNIGPQMRNVNASAYLRFAFAPADSAQVGALTLRMDYDDGFIAYLNGTRVASRNATGSPGYNSTATGVHEASGPVEIDLTAYKDLLRAEDGGNVLAIHALNVSAGDADMLIVAALSYTTMHPGVEQYFATPTPRQANQVGALGFVADTKFSHDRGFYDSPIDVTITTTTAGAQIRYTLDGTDPTATTGTRYITPIHIDWTTTVKAGAFKTGYISTNVDTQTYLFLDDILAQTGAGLPQTWGYSGININNPPGPDYAMDAAVVAANAATIRNDMKSLPVVSLVMSMDNWFGAGGVGIYPQGVAIERPVSVEYFNPDGTNAFQANAGVQIVGGGIGGTSADRWKSYKLSMRLLFKTIYGPGNIEHDIYGEGATDHFDTLVLDAHLNHTWTHPTVDQQTTARFLTDTFVSDAQNAMGGSGPHSQFVHLYLNGVYWGMYDIHERPDEHFAEEYFGGQAADYDVIKHGLQYGSEAIVNGDPALVTADYQELVNRVNADMTVLSNYQRVEEILDIDQFIDYMIANFYGGNLDWGSPGSYKNFYATYNRVDPNGKWRFHSWDAEHSLEGVNDVAGGTNTNHPTGIHSRLKLSPEYRLRFADRVQRHFLTAGGTFYVDPTNSTWDPAHPERNVPASLYYDRMQEIDRAIVGESARWGDNRRAGAAYTRQDWVNTQNAMLGSYFPQRSTVVLNQFKNVSNGLYPATGAPGFSKPSGGYSAPCSLTISKPGAGKIYYTTDGSDPRLPGGAINTGHAKEFSLPVTLWKSGRVKARVLDGANWSALCEATYVIGSAPPLRIAELMYNPVVPQNSVYLPQDYEFIELVNVGPQVVDPGWFSITEGVKSTFYLDTQLEVGDRIVLVRNEGAFEERYGQGRPVMGTYEGELADGGERLVLVSEFGQAMEDITYKDGWYSQTDGEGYSLVAIDPSASDAILSTKEGWRASEPVNGAPGQADPGYNPNSIIINEVMSHPSADLGDWIELHNTTDGPIDVSGWFLSDSDDDLRKYQMQPGTIIAKHGFLVLTQAEDFGNAAAPGCRLVFGFQEHTGDQAYLSSEVNGEVGGYREKVEFGAADRDVSFGQYVKSTGGTDFVAMATPTREGPNSVPLVGPIVINEMMYAPSAGGDEWIELRNITVAAAPLYDPLHSANTWHFTNGISFTFSTGDAIPAGGFGLVGPIAPAEFRSKYGIAAEVPVFGPYTGQLDNVGESVDLSKPGDPEADGFVPYVVVDHIKYSPEAPWAAEAASLGVSLGRRISRDYGNDPANWAAIPNGGNPGQANFDEPPTVAIQPVDPDPRSTSVDSITIVFSEAVTGFDLADLALVRNVSGNLLTAAQTLATSDHITYVLGNLVGLTGVSGVYTLKLTAVGSGIADAAGNGLEDDVVETFTAAMDSTPPAAAITAVDPDPRTTSVDSITIVFSEAVTGFDLADLALVRNGSGNLLTAAQTLVTSDSITYVLGNLADLTWPEGAYALSLIAAGSQIEDAHGNDLAEPASEGFVVSVTTLPARSPEDELDLRVSGSWLEIRRNAGPGEAPTYVLPLSEVTELRLTQGHCSVGGDLRGLRMVASGSEAARPTAVTFGVSQHLAGLSLAGSVRAALSLAGGGVLRTGGLSISGGGILDIAENDLIIQSTAADRGAELARVFNWIKSARSGGAGIATSAGGQATTLAVSINDTGTGVLFGQFAGEAVDANCVLVKYTWDGDMNLDGVVNADDYFLIDSGFLSQAAGYRNGDLNYDGVVNADDYFLIDSAFLGQTGPLAAAAAAESVNQEVVVRKRPEGQEAQLEQEDDLLA